MLTLIDGNSLLFRAYYGVHARLTRADGTPTGAVYGFLNMILPILAQSRADDEFVCVFDASRISFRQDIYPQYKMNRSETPADLIAQGQIVQAALMAMGMPVLCVNGVEADDVIATLATQNCNRVDATRIISSDKDLMQLVSDCVFLYDGMKAREVREDAVLEKFGVKPNRVIDVQALMGDASDNVPGVPGIGPKKAAELINQFGSLDGLYENLDMVKNERIRGLLRDNQELAFVSKKLVTLKTDVDLSGLKLKPFVFNKIGILDFVAKNIESKSLIAKIDKSFPDTAVDNTVGLFSFPGNACHVQFEDTKDTVQNAQREFNCELITSVAALDRFLAKIDKILAIDTETTGLNQMTDKIVGISLAVDDVSGAYIPLRHRVLSDDLFGDGSDTLQQLDIDTVYQKLWPFLTSPDIIKIGHNLKYDLHILENEGWETSQIAPIDDTMLLSYVLHGSTHGHGLDELATRYLGHHNITFASLFPSKTRDVDMHFDALNPKDACDYACEDACICRALYDILRPELDAKPELKNLYDMCDLSLMPVLLKMERIGVLVDREKLNNLSVVFHQQLQNLADEIWDLAGHQFNIASPKQLGVVLFDELGLPANKKRSTDADALAELQEQHEIVEKILNWRSVAKLAGTYADALPRQIAADGRIHTTYLQTSTNTGRLSSREPNLQNIPVKTALGEEIRKCFVAQDGCVLISVDYSQIQLRLLADIANVKTFRDTFNAGADIHEQTARKIFEVPVGVSVSKEQRRAAKTVNFSIIYGISSFGLAAQLGVGRAKAKEIIDSYMRSLPEIQKYIEETKQFALEHACVYTPWGRRIELPEIKNPRLRSYALRAAINAPIQGFEADLMRRAMVLVEQQIVQKNSDKLHMIMQVHDEMVFECRAEFAEVAAQQIKNVMENVAQLSVPLIAESVISPVWGK